VNNTKKNTFLSITQEDLMTIQSGKFRRLTLIIGVAAMVYVSGCSSNKPKEDVGGVPTAPSADENTATGDSDTSKALGLQTIHFPYDSFAIDSENKGILQANANILKDKASVKIQVEGHTDARGGIQYNIALGEKRANSVKKLLEDLGISSDRITVISFGKERPVDPGTSEEAYAKNRRANFVITSH
jgi:peptidoglycan-associated lipoprotein